MKLLGTQLGKREDRLKEAARTMMKAGNFQEYCNIMMQLGLFEEAIAAAPKVSMKFWQSCIEQYKEHLGQQMSAQSSDFGALQRDPASNLADFSILTSNFNEATTLLADQD